MVELTQNQLIVIGESIFIALALVSTYVVVLRKRLRQLRQAAQNHRRIVSEHLDTIKEQNKYIGFLKKKIENAEKNAAESPSCSVAAGISDRALGQKSWKEESDENSYLVMKQRVENLEKFRELYIELEASLMDAPEENVVDQRQSTEELERIVAQQKSLIEELMRDLVQMSMDEAFEQSRAKELQDKLKALEGSSDDMQDELVSTKRRLSLVSCKEKELEQYRDRLAQVEMRERQLSQQVYRYQQGLEDTSGDYSRRSQGVGAVRIAEIEELSVLLKRKENELFQLRKECTTLSSQYQTLARQSLDKEEETAPVSEEECVNLKTALENAISELERKQREYDDLEKSFLNLTKGQEELPEEGQKEYNEAISEHQSLMNQVQGLVKQVAILSESDSQSELEQAKTELEKKESELQSVREKLEKLEREAMELRQKDSNMSDENVRLMADYEKLIGEHNELKDHMEDYQAVKEELESLRYKHAQLESRYISMTEKYRPGGRLR